MPSSNEYDADLLNSAPQVDKRAIQEGYRTDILLQEAEKRNSPIPQQVNLGGSTGHGHGSPIPQRDPSHLESQISLTKAKKPFYRTTKGQLITGVVLVAVIVAAVVGGVVGSRNSKGGQQDEDSQTGGSDSEGEGEQSGGSGSPASDLLGVGGSSGETARPTGSAILPFPSLSVPLPLPSGGGDTGNAGETPGENAGGNSESSGTVGGDVGTLPDGDATTPSTNGAGRIVDDILVAV